MESVNSKRPSLVEVAKKQRQISIIKKLQSGRINKSEVKELEDYEKGPLPEGCVNTLEQVAKAFGKSVRTVGYWVKDGMPVERDGTYNLKTIQAWRSTKAEKRGASGSLFNQKTTWEIARLQEDVRKRKIDNDVKRGKLIPRATVEKELVNISLAMKRELLLLPNTVALKCVGQDARTIKTIVQGEVVNVLNRIAEAKIFDKIKEKHGKDSDHTNTEPLD